MSKIFSRPIKVAISEHCGQPGKIKPEREWLHVEKIMDCWHDTGCWWSGESEKAFFRFQCREGMVCEVFQDLSSREWFLYKVYD